MLGWFAFTVNPQMRPDRSTVFIALFSSVILVVPVAYFGRKYWNHKTSEGWPKIAATFERGSLEVRMDENGLEHYAVAMTFNYQIAGQVFYGEYKKYLVGYDEKDANQLLKSLREGPLYVRYRPSKPKDYVCEPFGMCGLESATHHSDVTFLPLS